MISFGEIAKGSDALVKIHSISTNKRVEFPAFVTNFSDAYSVGWTTESVYGRMDPIKNYTGTTRTIAIAFDVVASSLEEARRNMSNYSKLIQMLYPVYSAPLSGRLGKGRTLAAPPLLRVQFMNLIRNNSQNSIEKGLLGCINGVTFDPNREVGFFIDGQDLLPKHFSISFNFEPQHEHELGFEGQNFITRQFPYGRSQSLAETTTTTQNPDVLSARASTITGED